MLYGICTCSGMFPSILLRNSPIICRAKTALLQKKSKTLGNASTSPPRHASRDKLGFFTSADTAGIDINATKTSAPQNDKSDQIPPLVPVKVFWASQHTTCCAVLKDRVAERAAAVAVTREAWILLLLPVILSPVESGKEEAPLVIQCPLPGATFCFSCCSVRCPTNNRPKTPASTIETISSQVFRDQCQSRRNFSLYCNKRNP